jgi:teichoic acid transport system ATP-binding protein
LFSRQKDEVTATLKDINLQIKKGDVVGVLGHNGAGKSTLLRLLSGIYQPDKGSVRVNGKISLLASLGTGFQRDLSGRDNIVLSGALHGIPIEKVRALVPSVILFSGLEDSIDKPLRTYSSGMRARLGFSIVAHLDPEILLFDEVFAVGDSSFRARSKQRIAEMVNGDSTVIIVTHNEQLIRDMCTRVICIDRGSVVLDTHNIEDAIKEYHQNSKDRDSKTK